MQPEYISILFILGLPILVIFMVTVSELRKRSKYKKQREEQNLIAEESMRQHELLGRHQLSQYRIDHQSKLGNFPQGGQFHGIQQAQQPYDRSRRMEQNENDILNPFSTHSPLNRIYQSPSYEAPARHESNDCGSHRHSSSDSHSHHGSSSSGHSCNYGSDSSSSSSGGSDW